MAFRTISELNQKSVPSLTDEFALEETIRYIVGSDDNSNLTIPIGSTTWGANDLSIVSCVKWDSDVTLNYLASHYPGAPDNSFRLYYASDTNRWTFLVSQNGSTAPGITLSSVDGPADVTGYRWWWLAFDISTDTVSIYTLDADPQTPLEDLTGWTLVGSDTLGVTVTSINTSSADIEVAVPDSTELSQFAIIKSLTLSDPPEVHVVATNDAAVGDTSFTATSGQTVTLNGASVASRTETLKTTLSDIKDYVRWEVEEQAFSAEVLSASISNIGVRNRVTFLLDQVSGGSTTYLLLQLLNQTSVSSEGAYASLTSSVSTTGFTSSATGIQIMPASGGAFNISGVISLIKETDLTWVYKSRLSDGAKTYVAAGSFTLGDPLDDLRLIDINLVAITGAVTIFAE